MLDLSHERSTRKLSSSHPSRFAAWADADRPPTLVRIDHPDVSGYGTFKLVAMAVVLSLPLVVAWFVTRDQLPRPTLELAGVSGMAIGPLPAAEVKPLVEWAIALEDPAPAIGPADFAGFLPAGDGDEPQSTDDYETEIRLGKGDTVAGLLHDLGLAREEVARVTAALASGTSLRRLPIGQGISVRLRAPGEGDDAKPILQTLVIRPEVRREVTVERDEKGDYSLREKIFETEQKVERASGTIDNSLIGSAQAAGVPASAMAEMLKAFSWDVNFQHDIKVGDRFDVLIEQSWTTDGKPVDGGSVLWASLTTGGGEKTHSIYRFKPQNGTDFFYDRDGRSVVKSLLRTPLNMSRISSRFGMRRHPVLGFTRLHAGVDFAAPTGTPILAAGAGTVVKAGRNGGYGNWVLIRHGHGMSTGYAHLNSIARGIRSGTRVRQGQVIGFVGSTGMSTGPHLHFELHRNGKPVNPLSVAQAEMRTSLSGLELTRFKAEVARIDRKRAAADVAAAQ